MATIDPQAQLDNDLRCLVSVRALADSGDPGVAALGQAGALYGMGRLSWLSEGDLERRLDAAAEMMQPGDLVAETRRCGAELQVEGRRYQRIGGRMSQKEARRQAR